MPFGLLPDRTPKAQLPDTAEKARYGLEQVKSLAWFEALEDDFRPSLILDLSCVDSEHGILRLLYSNAAYKDVDSNEPIQLFNSNNEQQSQRKSSTFGSWAYASAVPTPDPQAAILQGEWLVSRVTIAERWRLIQSTKLPAGGTDSRRLPATTIPIAIPKAISESRMTGSAPTARSPYSSLDGAEMYRSLSEARSPQDNPIGAVHLHPLLKSADWSQSPLGHPETWSSWMRQTVGSVLADPDPHVIIWKDGSLVYNDAVVPLISSKHPAALGRDAAVTFEEIWSELAPLIEGVKTSHKSIRLDAVPLPMHRRGFLEETHWSFTLLPLRNGQGEAVGVVDRFTEVTSSVVATRRLDQVNLLGEKTGEISKLHDLWDTIMDVMSTSALDSPYAMIYSIEDSQGRIPTLLPDRDVPADLRCNLKSFTGLESVDTKSLASFYLSDSAHFLAQICATSFREAKTRILKANDGTLPIQLQLAIPSRGFGDMVNAALVVPIKTGAGKAVAVLIKALNPRRPVDADYLVYSRLMSRRLNDAFTRVFIPEEERQLRLECEKAAMEQASLAQSLQIRTRQAEDEAAAFTKLAENAPIGMYMYTPEGFPVYINDYYFQMTGLQKEKFEQFSWLEAVHADDRTHLMDYWHQLYDERSPVTFEFRMSKPYKRTAQDGSEVVTDSWALASAFPQIDEEGEVINIIGWQIDISTQKWAEAIQKERLKDALESRAQAHRFIDMVSHECRNPLSAILQSADGILSSLGPVTQSDQSSLHEIIENVQDSAQTIVLCAQHQKRIVDDILTVSKLDGNHLIITPDKADPIALVRHVLKMYEAELGADSIETEVVILAGYRIHVTEYVLLDPSRTLQVLINLVTNAIKFTAPSKRRRITISIDASRERPSTGQAGTAYVPQRTARLSPTTSHPDWATGRDLYVQFAVQDTGRGMNNEEMEKLFERFAQASPRTHIKYGGSGLGLFISRQLTELQGGQIGVSSKLGYGSTFAFYITARTSGDPQKPALRSVSTPGPFSSASSTEHRTSFPFPQFAGQSPRADKTRFEHGQLTTSPKAISFDHEEFHVLIVEDNLINQKVMAKQLRKLGCTVHVANHGIEALSFLKRSVFAVEPPREGVHDGIPLDVILMDIEMPVMDGMTCVREIRAMEKRGELKRHVPVIAVTANARDAQQTDAVKDGMDQIVTKPFRIPELVPKMQDLVWAAKREAMSDSNGQV